MWQLREAVVGGDRPRMPGELLVTAAMHAVTVTTALAIRPGKKAEGRWGEEGGVMMAVIEEDGDEDEDEDEGERDSVSASFEEAETPKDDAPRGANISAVAANIRFQVTSMVRERTRVCATSPPANLDKRNSAAGEVEYDSVVDESARDEKVL
jgi:hypothetical protein